MTQDLLTELGDLAQKYHQAQSTVAQLQQQVESQTFTLQEQSNRIQQLESTLAQSQMQLARVAQLDGQLEYLKEELLQKVEERYGQPQTNRTPTVSNSLTQQQLDSHTDTLKSLRRDMDKTQRYDDQIALARTESTRLNKDMQQLQADFEKLSKALDERTKPLNYIEDQRRATAQSLAEIQAQLPKLNQKIDNYVSKLQMVEQKTPQFAKYEIALDSLRDDIRRHKERMDFQAAERERPLKNWTDLAQTTEQRMRENESMLEKYAEHYQLNKRVLASLQDFQEQMQREQHRLSELQRLAEERQRTEFEKIQADNEHHWQKQSMELQPQLGDFQKSMETIQEQIDKLTTLNKTLESQTGMILQIIEEDVQARAAAVDTWQQRIAAIASEQE